MSSLVNVGNTIETEVDVGKTIATTNYDNIVEVYHRIKEFDCVDGFRRSADPAKSYLDFKSFSERADDRWLIKLHGSAAQQSIALLVQEKENKIGLSWILTLPPRSGRQQSKVRNYKSPFLCYKFRGTSCHILKN